ncbi:hypothetical protein AS156_06605 [Bradyrhizobium macuxiense]|uniref:Uncharacterized protein n=1 Tax=Bradyrhizobium macuxiense TaxID=1755647 RepID=A0A125Q8L9_9BRAD|nr:hypothetical protein [Bradyrhizobium macuxiense]KWV54647.1 hypothetical protein AS156_06605 [Bradyrhizobium macuxiense]
MDEVDSVAGGARYRVQVVGSKLGGVVGQEALDSIARIWARKDDGAPSFSVCHVPDLDWENDLYRQAATDVLMLVKKAGARLKRPVAL